MRRRGRAPDGGNRIEAVATPGMATQDAAERQPAAPQRPVRTQRFQRVERAARRETAAVRQRRRDQIPINENEALEKSAQQPIEAVADGGDEAVRGADERPLPFARSAKAERRSASSSEKAHVRTAARATST